MPQVVPPSVKDETFIKPVTPTPVKPKYTPEEQAKRTQLEKYMEAIWKGDYSIKGSIELIWRLFNEPKKQG